MSSSWSQWVHEALKYLNHIISTSRSQVGNSRFRTSRAFPRFSQISRNISLFEQNSACVTPNDLKFVRMSSWASDYPKTCNRYNQRCSQKNPIFTIITFLGWPEICHNFLWSPKCHLVLIILVCGLPNLHLLSLSFLFVELSF